MDLGTRVQELLEANSRYVEERQAARNRAEEAEGQVEIFKRLWIDERHRANKAVADLAEHRLLYKLRH